MKKLVCDICGKEATKGSLAVTLSSYYTISVWVSYAPIGYTPNTDFALCTEHYIEALEKTIQKLKKY